MAHQNTVIKSINLEGEAICVDIFQRPDDTFGFDEFRRDPEDSSTGWCSIGHYGAAIFRSADAALEQARATIHWLDRGRIIIE